MYLTKRGSTKNSALKVYREYTKTAQRLETKGGGKKQHFTNPYLEPRQSKKLTRKDPF